IQTTLTYPATTLPTARTTPNLTTRPHHPSPTTISYTPNSHASSGTSRNITTRTRHLSPTTIGQTRNSDASHHASSGTSRNLTTRAHHRGPTTIGQSRASHHAIRHRLIVRTGDGFRPHRARSTSRNIRVPHGNTSRVGRRVAAPVRSRRACATGSPERLLLGRELR
ncbi:hypothetical protein, partial [Nocardia brasiliensis]|uniref:hypothetical protein n=1 Tax=Nocardia brasiliensis TaxID=37326 RepID=UPI0024550B13